MPPSPHHSNPVLASGHLPFGIKAGFSGTDSLNPGPTGVKLWQLTFVDISYMALTGRQFSPAKLQCHRLQSAVSSSWVPRGSLAAACVAGLVSWTGCICFLVEETGKKLEATQGQLHAMKPDAKIDILAWKINASALLDLLYSRRLDLVVHLAGPFQGQDYAVAKACLQAGVPYIDMVDGREFVTKFTSLDSAAQAKGIPLITGASTVPGLSSAIIDGMIGNFSQVQAIDYGICAGVKSSLGLATLQAVLSYCGKPYRVLKDGRFVTIFGLGRPRHHDFPSPVNRRYVVDCDIPDHDLFPTRYTDLRQMDFGSCIDIPGPPRMLSLMSACVRKGWTEDWNCLSTTGPAGQSEKDAL
jgi:hypothetical protein